MSEHKKIEEHFLPRELRLDLCVSLLENQGAEKINVREARGEIIHCCLMPWHDEKKPSASLNFDRLTYKCLGCQARGGLYWLIATVMGTNGQTAREWLSGVSGLGGAEFQLGPLLDFLDAIDESVSKGQTKPMMPHYSEKVLEPWGHIYPGWTTGVPELGIPGAGIPEANLIEARVGWDMEIDRIVIPFWVDGNLVGWQSRRILDDGSPKYLSTPDFPRYSTLYGAPEKKDLIIVVESPKSQLRHRHHAPIAATWGSAIAPEQIQILKWYREVCFMVDPDDAGWKTIDGYINEQGEHVPGPAQILAPYTNVTVADHDWYADPAELDDQQFDEAVANRIPAYIWNRPTDLFRCLRCQEKHSGHCRASLLGSSA